MTDGPLPYGRPVPARGPGVFLIELPAPLPTAPLELTRLGVWLGRVPTLRLDGEIPTSKALQSRLASFWLPSQTVLYIGATETSIGGRIAAMDKTVLGDRRPHSGGHWLKTLRDLSGCRVWWASTGAVDEYEDALLSAFAEGVPDEERRALPDSDVVLPFANLRRPTGERKATGLTGSLIVEPREPAPPPTRVVIVPDGDAEGANGEPPPSKRARGGAGTRPASKTPTAPSAATSAATSAAPSAATSSTAATSAATSSTPATPTSVTRAASAAGAGRAAASSATTSGPRASRASSSATKAPSTAAAPDPSILTAEGIARLQAELDDLIQNKRPGVIARIRTAKEFGDLKENADYTAAREEQSFLEGRIQAIEARLRTAVVADAPAGDKADLGSVVTIVVDGEEPPIRYTLVGSAEADLAAGRLSVASPVGRALLGARVDEDVVVATPRGTANYRIVAIE
jgi:transcription elongation factor GreA